MPREPRAPALLSRAKEVFSRFTPSAARRIALLSIGGSVGPHPALSGRGHGIGPRARAQAPVVRRLRVRLRTSRSTADVPRCTSFNAFSRNIHRPSRGVQSPLVLQRLLVFSRVVQTTITVPSGIPMISAMSRYASPSISRSTMACRCWSGALRWPRPASSELDIRSDCGRLVMGHRNDNRRVLRCDSCRTLRLCAPCDAASRCRFDAIGPARSRT